MPAVVPDSFAELGRIKAEGGRDRGDQGLVTETNADCELWKRAVSYWPLARRARKNLNTRDRNGNRGLLILAISRLMIDNLTKNSGRRNLSW